MPSKTKWVVLTTSNCRTSRRKAHPWKLEADSYVVFQVLACCEGPTGTVESARVLFPHGQKAVDDTVVVVMISVLRCARRSRILCDTFVQYS